MVPSLSDSDLELLSESLELNSTPLECAASNELQYTHTKNTTITSHRSVVVVMIRLWFQFQLLLLEMCRFTCDL